ncbi:MAG: ABC transporter, partial [Sphingobium sp.]|nr:ABC transporter [Sphingobium sp.]
TLVIITHDPTLADRCGRIVEMRDGLIFSDRAA